MINEKSILAVILARGGSKGIPGKNIKELKGKPLIAYTIEEAKKSEYIDRIILSTDDNEIARVGQDYGAEVPFMRPEELARDDSLSRDAILHALDWLEENEDYTPEYLMILQPTSPLREVKDIDNSIEKIVKEDADSIIGICETEKHPYWMIEIKTGEVVPFNKEGIKCTRRQDLPDIYHINGAIYVAKTELYIKNEEPWRNEKIGTIPYIMPKERSVDIDNMLDWKLVELLLEEENND